MSKSADLSMRRCFALAEKLKTLATDFVKKEQRVVREIGSRRLGLTHQQSEITNEIDEWIKGESEKAVSAYETEANRLRQRAERRLSKLQKIHRTRSAGMEKEASEARERWISDLQFRHFNAGRKLAADQKQADKSNAEFAVKLEDWNKALGHLETGTRRAFGGYRSFLNLLQRPAAGVPDQGDHLHFFLKFESQFRETQQLLAGFVKHPLSKFFAALPLFVSVPLVIGAGIGTGFLLAPSGWLIGNGAGLALVCLLIILHLIGAKQAKTDAETLAASVVLSRALLTRALEAGTEDAEQEKIRLQEEYDSDYADISTRWGQADDVGAEFLERIRTKIEVQYPRILARHKEVLAPKLAKIEEIRDNKLAAIQAEVANRTEQTQAVHQAALDELDKEEARRWNDLQMTWERETRPIYEAVAEMRAATDPFAPDWNPQLAENWSPARTFPATTRFGKLHVDLNKEPGQIPLDPRLALPGPAAFDIPLALSFPEQGSLLFETADSSNPTVIGTLNNIILSLLTTTPPGKISFTIIDPVGLGENFAGLMHLSDYEESLINRRIWTQQSQIEERLAEMNEHLEKVIQMYLRNEYATITEYNLQAGSVAEKYHFLVVADFPTGFSDTAARRLQSVAASGSRCGVFTLVHWDRRQNIPDGLSIEELKKSAISIRRDRMGWVFDQEDQTPGDALVFDSPAAPELAVELVRKIGAASIDSNRVEVPFSQVAPTDEQIWTGDTTNELRIAIGRTGATKLQYLAIGKGTRQHALFAGKTGSGKSTLFHVIITNLALSCSPEQVEFYLIDFKKGVEFKCYAEQKLPHARVIAIESDREFALSVLQRVDEELKRRGDLFRKLGVQDVAGFKRAGGSEPMPRCLLIIDEFQEFFVEDDSIGQTASLLFDRIVRQGRAFGIHVLLGSQTLGGAYTLARATLGQMAIRVALQCNEADAYLIMDDNNPAPRLLTRPGEGIYNDAAGAMEGNSPFQVVWLPDQERDLWLEKVSSKAAAETANYPGPIVFEGNAPANIRENPELQSALAGKIPSSPRAWLGAPNAIKGPTAAIFQPQSGNHLLVVGQREEPASVMLFAGLVSLAASAPEAHFVLIHSMGPGSLETSALDKLSEALDHRLTRAQAHQLPEVLEELNEKLKLRSSGEAQISPSIFVLIHEVQKFKKLRQEDEFAFGAEDSGPSPASILGALIAEGASLGIHLMLTFDTFNNVSRFLSRKSLTEFEMRVVFQMSANDSASLLDTPIASNLGLHRAIFYNEREGRIETFRPYSAPDSEWVESAAEIFKTADLA